MTAKSGAVTEAYIGGLRITAAGATDVGRCHEANQDSFAVRADLGLFVVADGVGGRPAGEVASRRAAEEVCAYVEQRLSVAPNPRSVLPDAVRTANLRVFVA